MYVAAIVVVAGDKSFSAPMIFESDIVPMTGANVGDGVGCEDFVGVSVGSAVAGRSVGFIVVVSTTVAVVGSVAIGVNSGSGAAAVMTGDDDGDDDGKEELFIMMMDDDGTTVVILLLILLLLLLFEGIVVGTIDGNDVVFVLLTSSSTVVVGDHVGSEVN